MKKVLIVEDDKFWGEAVKMKFSQSGFDITVASDGELGLDEAKEKHPDIILCDINLPGISGTEFLRKIKKMKN